MTGTGSGGSGSGGGGNNPGGGGDRDYGRRRDGDKDYHRRHRRYRHDGKRIYDTSDDYSTTRAQSASIQDECDRGYDDGLESGAKDARRGLSSDPNRSSRYRNGGGGIFSPGRSAAAKQAYRDCFLKGYEEGYRNPNTY